LYFHSSGHVDYRLFKTGILLVPFIPDSIWLIRVYQIFVAIKLTSKENK